MNVFLFQCCDDVSYYDHTLHLLCHYAGNMKLETARTEVLTDFLHVRENYKWFAKVTKKLLLKKGTTLKEYVVSMLSGKVPLDEAGILLFARATGLHFGVYYSDAYWCTNADRDPSKWDAFFMYAGNLKFFDTQPGAMDSDDCNEILHLDAQGKPRGRSKKAVRTKSMDDENDQRPSVLSSKKRKRRHLFDKVDDPNDDDYDPHEDDLKPRKRSIASKKSGLPLSASSVALTAMQQAKAKVKPKRATKEAAVMSLMPQGYEPWARRTRAGKKHISAAAGSASALIPSDDKDDISARETEQSNPNASAKSTPEADKSSDKDPADETDKSKEKGSAKSTTDKYNNGSAKSTTDKYNNNGSAKSTPDKSTETNAENETDKSNDTGIDTGVKTDNSDGECRPTRCFAGQSTWSEENSSKRTCPQMSQLCSSVQACQRVKQSQQNRPSRQAI